MQIIQKRVYMITKNVRNIEVFSPKTQLKILRVDSGTLLRAYFLEMANEFSLYCELNFFRNINYGPNLDLRTEQANLELFLLVS